MKVSLLLSFAVVVVPTAMAYQVNSDNVQKVYKQAIETSLHTAVMAPMLTSTDAMSLVSNGLTMPVPNRDPGPPKYWFNTKIHTFGNTGFFGAIHAALAPVATKIIDVCAYEGRNVRERISSDLHRYLAKPGARVADLCCGVGISTRALQAAFNDAELVVGVDTSPEMIAMAQMMTSESMLKNLAIAATNAIGGADATSTKAECYPHYEIGNAERTNLLEGSFDLVTVMYAFHEAPFFGRDRILLEVRRLLSPGATLAVVDISPNYNPSETMLAGEPYVLEYQRHIHDQLLSTQGFEDLRYREVVPGHVGLWMLTRSSPKHLE